VRECCTLSDHGEYRPLVAVVTDSKSEGCRCLHQRSRLNTKAPQWVLWVDETIRAPDTMATTTTNTTRMVRRRVVAASFMTEFAMGNSPRFTPLAHDNFSRLLGACRILQVLAGFATTRLIVMTLRPAEVV